MNNENIKNENIIVVKDRQINLKDEVIIRFTYNEKLTLKELSETFDLTNKAINDLNRENGVGSNAKIGQEYATEVTRVEHGSIILFVALNIVLPVTMSVLSNYIYDRLSRRGSKKEKGNEEQRTNYPVRIIVNADENVLEIQIGSGE